MSHIRTRHNGCLRIQLNHWQWPCNTSDHRGLTGNLHDGCQAPPSRCKDVPEILLRPLSTTKGHHLPHVHAVLEPLQLWRGISVHTKDMIQQSDSRTGSSDPQVPQDGYHLSISEVLDHKVKPKYITLALQILWKWVKHVVHARVDSLRRPCRLNVENRDLRIGALGDKQRRINRGGAADVARAEGALRPGHGRQSGGPRLDGGEGPVEEGALLPAHLEEAGPARLPVEQIRAGPSRRHHAWQRPHVLAKDARELEEGTHGGRTAGSCCVAPQQGAC
mmetsp:Transcript_82126/g.232554  ORF Transcript_82126/g.232554 Transcript_82126/m.232554 type:complete len:277 (-) Transcript_82126:1575-2405(-)